MKSVNVIFLSSGIKDKETTVTGSETLKSISEQFSVFLN